MSEQALVNPPRRARGGPDRVTVALCSLTAFLLVLALLGAQLSHAGSNRGAARRSILVRRIYKTTVIERVLPAGVGGPGGTSVAQSVSGSSSGSLPSTAPVTRTS
jgi:hypothetical protein